MQPLAELEAPPPPASRAERSRAGREGASSARSTAPPRRRREWAEEGCAAGRAGGRSLRGRAGRAGRAGPQQSALLPPLARPPLLPSGLPPPRLAFPAPSLSLAASRGAAVAAVPARAAPGAGAWGRHLDRSSIPRALPRGAESREPGGGPRARGNARFKGMGRKGPALHAGGATPCSLRCPLASASHPALAIQPPYAVPGAKLVRVAQEGVLWLSIPSESWMRGKGLGPH